MAKHNTKTKKYDVVQYLDNEEDMAAYLQAAFEDGDPTLIIHALGNIARARGMTAIARETKLRRESLYKALSPEGNPEFATVLKVIHA
ncbi:MAG: addiction module antidote protein, partial [Thermoguttaceae bacterium]